MEFTGERCILGNSDKLLEEEHIDRYRFALGYVNDKVVLDIACGSGYGSKLLSAKAKEVIGVDVSKESIEYARKNFHAKNVKFQLGDATNLYFIKDNSLDAVISFETIEHIYKYENFLNEIKRVLKKRGTFIVSTPNKRYSSNNLEKPRNQFHVIEFYIFEFNSLLLKYFSDVEIFG